MQILTFAYHGKIFCDLNQCPLKIPVKKMSGLTHAKRLISQLCCNCSGLHRSSSHRARSHTAACLFQEDLQEDLREKNVKSLI